MVGGWDYFITDLTESEFIQLCHESDIHFEINNEAFISEIQKKLESLQIPCRYQSG